MKKLLILLALLLANVLIGSGCDGLVDDYAERKRRYRQITSLNTRMLVDDWDNIWLYDDNSHLTRWHPRVGK